MGTTTRPGSADRQLWLMPNEGATGHDVVADVAVAAPATHLYPYAVPLPLIEAVRPGAVVEVPFGRGGRRIKGLCVRVGRRQWTHTLRPISSAGAAAVWLPESLVELGLWVSRYYLCSPWTTFTAVLPTALRRPRLKAVKFLQATGVEPTRKLTAGQAALLAAIGDGEVRRSETLACSGVSPSVLRSLCKRGLVRQFTREEPVTRVVLSVGPDPRPAAEDSFTLTDGQARACAQVTTALGVAGFRVFLLFGVPGSGKTEVYVRCIRAAVQAGRQAILLLPEIALATQVVDRLARRFARVAVLHSRLSARVRLDTLMAIAAGEIDVVIGTRTAVFAPCPRLGLIVVDEEQETSFKSLARPLYHARDVAIKRGQIEQVPVVLGSATPAMETLYNAQRRQHYELLRLPERVPGASLPRVRRDETGRRGLGQTSPLISPRLHDELQATLDAGQQAILLHNRRGYAVLLRCVECGLIVCCERCGSRLVYHSADRSLKCHRCGLRAAPPARCLDDSCRGRVERSGSAIQRLEEDLRAAFPRARLLRLDSDTMRRRDDYADALRRFEDGAADIMLGTQMVAKGLDFPRVRLVGVVEADAALSLPDFRAGERVFQLVMQVVGRAGRKEGESLALVQAADPPPAPIRHAVRMDYETFAAEELADRERFDLPPFVALVRIVLADPRPGQARGEATSLVGGLRERAGRISAALRVDEAEACVLRQLRGLRRWQIIIRGPRDGSVQSLLSEVGRAKDLKPRVRRLTIDVDPVDLL